MKVAWFAPPLLHSQAERLGLLDTGDLDFIGVANRSSDEQFKFLQSGTVDAVVSAMDNVIMWNRRPDGGDLRIIAEIEGKTGLSLVSSAGIGAIADLKGKRLLVDSAENGFVIALRALLADAGVEFDGCTIIPAGGVVARLEGMVADEGDATLLGIPFTEMAEAKGLRRLADVETAYPAFPGQGIIARQPIIAEKADELKAWLSALEQSRAWCRSHPAELVAILTGQGTPEPIAQRLAGFVGDSLVPSMVSIELLIGQRQMLGLPGGDATAEALVELALVAGIDGACRV